MCQTNWRDLKTKIKVKDSSLICDICQIAKTHGFLVINASRLITKRVLPILQIFLVISHRSRDSNFPTFCFEIESLIRPQNRPTEAMCKKRKTIFCKASNTIAKLSWTRNELQICKTKNLLETPVLISFFAK